MGSLGCPTSTWYQSSTRSTLSATQNHDWQPTGTLTIKNNSTIRHAITQILTPRDLQTNATQFPTSQDLQIRARSSPNHIPSLATRILHPETNRKAHYSPKTCDPNHVSNFEDYHKIKNREHKFHPKKKKNQIHNFKPPNWEQESWQPTLSRRSHQRNDAITQPTTEIITNNYRQHTVTIAPTMPLHGFWDLTHQPRSPPSSSADGHHRRAQPTLRRRLQKCFMLASLLLF